MPVAKNPEAQRHFEAATALLDDGKLAEAESRCRAGLRLAPDDAPALRILGHICIRTSRPRDALASLQRSLALEPHSPQGHLHLGSALLALQRPQEALLRFEKAAALDPALGEAHARAGDALVALGRADDAVAAFRRALALDPRFVPAHFGLGMLLAAMQDYARAVEHLGVVDSEWPGRPEVVYALGNSLFGLFRAEEALAQYQRLCAMAPDYAPAHLGAGNALQSLGRIAEARTSYERALALMPEMPTVHRAVADIKTFQDGDPQLTAMESLARHADRYPVQERISLHFALAKAYDDLDRRESAFSNWQAGNSLKRRTVAYDEAATLGLLRDMEAVFTADLLRPRAGSGDLSEAPIFIVGMPRSGTTLVEQMLASHPRVMGGGEQRHLQDALEDGARASFPAGIAELGAEDLRRLGREYVARLKMPEGAERKTDKLPANFRYIGAIQLALPKARIIHVMRDPMDTCFSCYTRLFPNGLLYTYDLGELGRYFRAYEALMAHWRRVLPDGAMLELRYEDLVEDFERQSRRVLDYCGLEWDDRCLQFHKTDRPIYTVSVSQVRQPLFHSSIGRWQRYERQLAPLLEMIGDRSADRVSA
ncbi:MAG: sulfotransferase [Alphaproteobacteria bacterium]|nr:sulfotransferase [Alphaproteobacteria bacterium]